MLSCPVLATPHFRIASCPSTAVHSCPSNSHGINLFADPHPLNPIASIFYKNHRGEGAVLLNSFPFSASASVTANYVPSAASACPDRFGLLNPVLLPTDYCPLITAHYPPNSHEITSFADPHTLNSVVSYRYKNIGGGGPFLSSCISPHVAALSPNSFTCHTSAKSSVSPSIATLPKTGVSKPCVCHTSETPRGWAAFC